MIETNSTITAKQIACANCGEPTTANKRIATDYKIYCTKLCAGLGLIQTACDEDGMDDAAVDELITLVERTLSEDPVPIPTRVRDRDAEAALELLDSGPHGHRRFIIVVDDESTPDWVPDPIAVKAVPKICFAETDQTEQSERERAQGEIDRVVDDLLRNGNEPEGRP